jgi:hypothetical protein
MMKRLILCSLLSLALSGFVAAQTSNGTSSTSSSGTMQSSNQGQSTKKSKKAAKKGAKNNNRKNYNWENGQQATPTGNEATGTNGGYSAIGRDTTRKTGRKQ